MRRKFIVETLAAMVATNSCRLLLMSEVGRNQRAGCADKYPNEADANAKEQIVTASMGFMAGMGTR